MYLWCMSSCCCCCCSSHWKYDQISLPTDEPTDKAILGVGFHRPILCCLKNCLGRAAESFSPVFFLYTMFLFIWRGTFPRNVISAGCLQVFFYFYLLQLGRLSWKKAKMFIDQLSNFDLRAIVLYKEHIVHCSKLPMVPCDVQRGTSNLSKAPKSPTPPLPALTSAATPFSTKGFLVKTWELKLTFRKEVMEIPAKVNRYSVLIHFMDNDGDDD